MRFLSVYSYVQCCGKLRPVFMRYASIRVPSWEFNSCAKLEYHIKPSRIKQRFLPTCSRELNREFRGKPPHLAVGHLDFSEPIIQSHDRLMQSHDALWRVPRSLFGKRVSIVVYMRSF